MSRVGHNNPPFDRRAWAEALFDDADVLSGAIAFAFALDVFADEDGRLQVADSQMVEWLNSSLRSVSRFKRDLLARGYVRVIQIGSKSAPSVVQMSFPVDLSHANMAHDEAKSHANMAENVTVSHAKNDITRQYGTPKTTSHANMARQKRHHTPIWPVKKRSHIEERAGASAHAYKELPKGNTPNVKEGGVGETSLPTFGGYGDDDYTLTTDGKLFLANGANSEWAEVFGGDRSALKIALLGFTPDPKSYGTGRNSLAKHARYYLTQQAQAYHRNKSKMKQGPKRTGMNDNLSDLSKELARNREKYR